MIQTFVDRFIASEQALKAELKAAHPEGYTAMVKRVVTLLAAKADSDSEYGEIPDPERIHVIDDGDYQGTKLYVIAAQGYQPSRYWSIFVDYGSCSGCDAYESTRDYSDETPTDAQVGDYYSMMLHMVQSMRSMNGVE